MNVESVKEALVEFTRKHRAAFTLVAKRESQLLELAAMVGVELHYRSNGYSTSIKSPGKGSVFVVKTSTRGHPSKYSFVVVEKDGATGELHMNLMVRGAHDEGIYCIDVGIVKSGVVPQKVDPDVKWRCIPNDCLISFAEAKRLPVYPMLLAQFIGIVHEIRPEFLQRPTPSGFGCSTNLPPALISLGRFSGNSKVIVDGFVTRGITVCIAENFDVRLAVHRKGGTNSPLYWDDPVIAGAVSSNTMNTFPDDELDSLIQPLKKNTEDDTVPTHRQDGEDSWDA
jgi:hypothetical protein